MNRNERYTVSGYARVRVYLNASVEGIPRGYRRGDTLIEALSFPFPEELSYGDSLDRLTEALEEVFDLGNILHDDDYRDHRLHDQAKRYRMAGNRPICVGDVVAIESPDGFTRYFSVDGVGWSNISGCIDRRSMTT